MYLDKVLAYGEIEEGGRACVIEVVVLEVVPEAGFDDVVVLNEVFPDDLDVEEPVFEFEESWGLIQVTLVDYGCLRWAEFAELAAARGPKHAVNEVGLGLGVVIGQESVDLGDSFLNRVAEGGFEELAGFLGPTLSDYLLFAVIVGS